MSARGRPQATEEVPARAAEGCGAGLLVVVFGMPQAEAKGQVSSTPSRAHPKKRLVLSCN